MSLKKDLDLGLKSGVETGQGIIDSESEMFPIGAFLNNCSSVGGIMEEPGKPFEGQTFSWWN